MIVMEPLSCPEILLTRPGRLERALMWVPVLGWLLDYLLLQRVRHRPMVEKVERQLRSRPKPDDSLWGSDQERLAVSHFVSNTLEREIGWPNDHFIPEDPLFIAAWAHWDGLDDTAFIMSIERKFGVELDGQQLMALWVQWTLGQFVDYVLEKSREGEKGKSLLRKHLCQDMQ